MRIKEWWKTLSSWAGRSLIEYGARLLRGDRKALEIKRVQAVSKFIYRHLPTLLLVNGEAQVLEVMESARCNYFTLPSGEIPYFDFILPRYALYICVLDTKYAPWAEARLWGVSRNEWEKAQEDVGFIRESMPDLATSGVQVQPRVLIVEWTDPVGPSSLTRRVQNLFGAHSPQLPSSTE